MPVSCALCACQCRSIFQARHLDCPAVQVLRELATDAQLDRFRAEYEKVFRALKKSHDSEKRLIKKCRELNTEIVGGAAKVQAALKLSDEDQATITALKREIENSWRMVDSSHEKVGAASACGDECGVGAAEHGCADSVHHPMLRCVEKVCCAVHFRTGTKLEPACQFQ